MLPQRLEIETAPEPPILFLRLYVWEANEVYCTASVNLLLSHSRALSRAEKENCKGHLAGIFWTGYGKQGCVSFAQSLRSAAPASEDTESKHCTAPL